MASWEMSYDSDEDLLLVTFESFDDTLARTIALNDNITLYTDAFMNVGWGLEIYGYSSLLQVNETYLDGLRPLSEADARRVMRVLETGCLTSFLRVTDPGELLAVLRAPPVAELLDL